MEQQRPYRVSTITWNGSVGTAVNYTLFFEHVRIIDRKERGFVWADYRGEKSRGVYPKKRRNTVNGEARKCFDNQLTLIMYLADGYFPNVKLFHNGNIHITGIRTPDDGVWINEYLVQEIRRIHAEHPDVVTDVESLQSGNYVIRMINSDFSVPYRIRRKDLHKLLISPEYNNQCVFQPGSYPGVKLQYYWNDQNTARDGICRCEGKCLGKGDGHGEGKCKKVTVAIFESGSILITGANAFDQIDDAYAYINKVLQQHNTVLRKVMPTMPSLPAQIV
jgi:TATA-box binding protein (TBP) (component of TFIID and TFIIIB)